MSFAGYFLVRSLLSALPAYLRTYFRFDLVWFRLSCDHGWVKQQQQQHSPKKETFSSKVEIEPSSTPLLGFQGQKVLKKKSVLGGTVGRHRRVLDCPVGKRRKKKRRSPSRLELGTLSGKASADVNGGTTSV